MATTAVLLANLGSPDSFEVGDVKKYLREFLMDERVIDIPYAVRVMLVKGIIVPFRSPKSAAKYKTIWTKDGSPLVYISRQVQQALAEQMKIPVALCMRYGNPTPQSALDELYHQHPNLKQVVLVPLYPHYAMSSYETAVLHVQNAHRAGRYPFEIRVVSPFYKHPSYIQVLAESIKPHLQIPHDHILFSYHGLPERHLKKTDPTRSHCMMTDQCCEGSSEAHHTCYRHQVMTTTRLTAQALGLKEGTYSFSFQSRLGADAWLKPYTAEQLSKFPGKGIRNLLVLSPAFVSDCLETLEEIQMEGKETFIHNGGESYSVIPCLNTHPDWIRTLEMLVKETMKSYSESKT